MADPDGANQPKRLYRPTIGRILAGVCSGSGNYFNTDASLIRLAWVAVTVLSGFVPGIIAYIVAAIVIPAKPTGQSEA